MSGFVSCTDDIPTTATAVNKISDLSGYIFDKVIVHSMLRLAIFEMHAPSGEHRTFTTQDMGLMSDVLVTGIKLVERRNAAGDVIHQETVLSGRVFP